MGLFTVEVMRGDALVNRSKVNADRFIEAAGAATKRRVREGRRHSGDWILVTHFVSDRTEEFVFDG